MLRPQEPRQFVAAHARHREIGQQEIERPARRGRERRRTIVRADGVVTGWRQDADDVLHDGRFIIDDQDTRSTARRRRRIG